MRRYAAFGLLVLVASCAWYESMLSRSVPDTRIVLQPGQVMRFSLTTRKNDAGQHIDEYRCRERELMICDGFATSLDCQCFSR